MVIRKCGEPRVNQNPGHKVIANEKSVRRNNRKVSLDLVSVSHRAKLLRVRQLIDRDVFPVLEPLRIALGMELVDCTNMRC